MIDSNLLQITFKAEKKCLSEFVFRKEHWNQIHFLLKPWLGPLFIVIFSVAVMHTELEFSPYMNEVAPH